MSTTGSKVKQISQAPEGVGINEDGTDSKHKPSTEKEEEKKLHKLLNRKAITSNNPTTDVIMLNYSPNPLLYSLLKL